MGQVFLSLCPETGLTNLWGCIFNLWHTRNSALKFSLHVFNYSCAMSVWGGQMWRWEDKLWASLVLSSAMWGVSLLRVPSSHPWFLHCPWYIGPLECGSNSACTFGGTQVCIFSTPTYAVALWLTTASLLWAHFYLKKKTLKEKWGTWWHTTVTPHLKSRGRRMRRSQSSLATWQIWVYSRIYETPLQTKIVQKKPS